MLLKLSCLFPPRPQLFICCSYPCRQIGRHKMMPISQRGGLAICFPKPKTNSPLRTSQQGTVKRKARLSLPCVPVYQGSSFIDSSIETLIKIFHASENSTAAKLSLISVLYLGKLNRNQLKRDELFLPLLSSNLL